MTISLNVSTSTQNPYATNTGSTGTTDTSANDANATQSNTNNFGPATIITLSANAELSLSQVADEYPDAPSEPTTPDPSPDVPRVPDEVVVVHGETRAYYTVVPSNTNFVFSNSSWADTTSWAQTNGENMPEFVTRVEQPPPIPIRTKAETSLKMSLVNPTPAELQALRVLHDKINDLDPKIRSIPDNAQIDIELSNGSHRIITGAEIKSLWENSKWAIDPVGTIHANGSDRGASLDANGYTHFNIDRLMNYQLNTVPTDPGVGAVYLVLHELMHNTGAGQSELVAAANLEPLDVHSSYPSNERWADRATASLQIYLGEPTSPNPHYQSYVGYTIPPMTVSPPPPPPPPIDNSLPGSNNDPGFDDSANNGGWRDMTT